MADQTDPKGPHDAGGTYAPTDMAPGAERDHVRDTQRYDPPKPEVAAQIPAEPPADDSNPEPTAEKP